METTVKSPDGTSRLIYISAAGFGLAYFGALYAAENAALPAPLRIGLALLPLPFFVGFLYAEGRLFAGLDELERKIQLEALGFAFPVSLVLIMALGLLERVIHLSPADWSYRHVWPLMVMSYFGGVALAKRRYQ